MGDIILQPANGVIPNRAEVIQVNTVPPVGDGISEPERGEGSGTGMGVMVQGILQAEEAISEEKKMIDLHFIWDRDGAGERRDLALLQKYLNDIIREIKYMQNTGVMAGEALTITVIGINHALGKLESLR
jgi:hypothetical protein